MNGLNFILKLVRFRTVCAFAAMALLSSPSSLHRELQFGVIEQSWIHEDAFSSAAAALCHPVGQNPRFAQLVRNRC